MPTTNQPKWKYGSAISVNRCDVTRFDATKYKFQRIDVTKVNVKRNKVARSVVRRYNVKNSDVTKVIQNNREVIFS